MSVGTLLVVAVGAVLAPRTAGVDLATEVPLGA